LNDDDKSALEGEKQPGRWSGGMPCGSPTTSLQRLMPWRIRPGF